jgi:hypothetical protein
MEINWNKNIEPHNKAEIEKHLNPFLWLVPKWCQEIHINLFDSSSKHGDSAIETITNYEYRFIQIDFFSCWLNCSDETKKESVIHELAHGFTNLIYYQARRAVIAGTADNEALQGFALDELSKTIEAATQDLAFAIYNKFNEQQNHHEKRD